MANLGNTFAMHLDLALLDGGDELNREVRRLHLPKRVIQHALILHTRSGARYTIYKVAPGRIAVFKKSTDGTRWFSPNFKSVRLDGVGRAIIATGDGTWTSTPVTDAMVKWVPKTI
jgi:hypothetical protein